jgi:pentose-5-phosphate-3-epimerase
MSIIPIVPAIIPKSASEIQEWTKTLRFSHELHVDVVDGIFVPVVSWPYSPQGDVIAVKPYTDSFTLEVDLMVQDPLSAAAAWEKAGADMLVFHAETINLESFTSFVSQTGITTGISFHGITSLEAMLPYIEVADYVQVMGIRDIGSQGQVFLEQTYDTIASIKHSFSHKMVSVDGSVNLKTISALAKSGMDRAIVGSAIVQQPQPHEAYRVLCAAVNHP